MNCNTTHYRANSSSVPGDPTSLPEDRASLGVAAGDFDADRHVDLLLTGVGGSRLLRNKGGKGFEDLSDKLPSAAPPALGVTARWLDLDQDGDLDLIVVNYTAAEHADAAFTDESAPAGVPNAVYRNDGVPPGKDVPEARTPAATATADRPAMEGLSVAFSPWADAEALAGGDARHTGIAALDIDGDRDTDLALTADGTPPTVAVNDRLGRFRARSLIGPDARSRFDGALVADLDRDGRGDLVTLVTGGGIAAWKNRSSRTSAQETFAIDPWPAEAPSWRSAVAADLDLDGWIDLVGLPGGPEAVTAAWARNEGDRLAARSLGLGADAVPVVGLAAADVVGDPLPDLILVKDGQGPLVARNLGNGNCWVALDLGGRWNIKPKLMRTNPHGLGTRLSLDGEGVHVPYEHTTQAAGPAQSVGPIVLGLGPKGKATLLHLRWPDGVMQGELDLAIDRRLAIAENNRKEGSCPVLFTWDGSRYVCLGDFLGGGGLGYLVAPGVYGEPDRDEAVFIGGDQLRATGGKLLLSVCEPMSEVAYLDRLELEEIHLPPGWSAALDERFAPGGNRPTGELFTWKTAIEPVRATDLEGVDVTDAVRAVDRKSVDGFRRREGWIGYAEEHGLVLDFGDRLAGFGPKDRLMLVLAGTVEYPYSQTNYAAATAGVPLRPPVLERRREDGTWEVMEPDPGYPAGMPRVTALELTGKLAGPSCVLRLRTNMDCSWDRAFLAVREPAPGMTVIRRPLAKAELGYRGYLREISPDGRLPLTYDYDFPDPAPLAKLEGRLTRFGDVAPLLAGDDDRLCVVGPGDEVRLEFAAGDEGPPDGWSACYVLRSVGYCKDADPFTAASDSVGPLPWKGMGPYPFGPAGERPRDAAYRDYLERFQTRPSGR